MEVADDDIVLSDTFQVPDRASFVPPTWGQFYRRDQKRIPAGQTGGGRFAEEGGAAIDPETADLLDAWKPGDDLEFVEDVPAPARSAANRWVSGWLGSLRSDAADITGIRSTDSGKRDSRWLSDMEDIPHDHREQAQTLLDSIAAAAPTTVVRGLRLSQDDVKALVRGGRIADALATATGSQALAETFAAGEVGVRRYEATDIGVVITYHDVHALPITPIVAHERTITTRSGRMNSMDDALLHADEHLISGEFVLGKPRVGVTTQTQNPWWPGPNPTEVLYIDAYPAGVDPALAAAAGRTASGAFIPPLGSDGGSITAALAARSAKPGDASFQFREDQPRVPAGSPKGGQWADTGLGWTAQDLFAADAYGKTEMVKALYEVDLGDGVRSVVTQMVTDSDMLPAGTIAVSGTIVRRQPSSGLVGSRDVPIGTWSRQIIPGDEVKAYHATLKLSPTAQGQGIGSKFAATVEDRYRDIGVDVIELNANIDVGGYAWARTGYDWDWNRPTTIYSTSEVMADRIDQRGGGPVDFGDQRKQIRQYLSDIIGRNPGGDWDRFSPKAKADWDRLYARIDAAETTDDFPTPFEMSAIGWEPGATTWEGKRGMLGSMWNATKRLRHPDPLVASADGQFYRRDQPRHPAGSDKGGEWTKAGVGWSVTDLRSIIDKEGPIPLYETRKAEQMAADLYTVDLGAIDGVGHVTTVVTFTKAKPWVTGRVDPSVRREPQVTVKGSVLADGVEIGKFSRVVKLGAAASVYHWQLTMNRDRQGQGVGSAFNAAMEARYREIGVEKITLNANVSVGGYAWARAGYDWDFEFTADEQGTVRDILGDIGDDWVTPALATPKAREDYQRISTQIDESFGPDDLPTPFEVSRIGWEPGLTTWYGKEAMLGTSWDGVKHL